MDYADHKERVELPPDATRYYLFASFIYIIASSG